MAKYNRHDPKSRRKDSYKKSHGQDKKIHNVEGKKRAKIRVEDYVQSLED